MKLTFTSKYGSLYYISGFIEYLSFKQFHIRCCLAVKDNKVSIKERKQINRSQADVNIAGL